MSARDWGYRPGDDGYEYPGDVPDDEPGAEPEPPQMCYLDGYGQCMDYGQCRFFGCYHKGMWRWAKPDPNAPAPQF